MKNLFITTIVGLALITIICLFVRGNDWIGCTVAQHDLGRPTSFSWISGKCMVENKNGDRVYLNQMRSMEGAE